MSGPSASAGPAVGERVGLFLCRCAGNLGRVVRVDELVATPWPQAAFVGAHDLLCGADGLAWLRERIDAERLTRIVVAACSPGEHEADFREAASAAGLSPWNVQRVSLREQVEWIGGGAVDATARAERLVRAGLARVVLHRDLPRREVEVSPDVVVIGGGPAGLAAARTLAGPDRRVVLIEREFALGGVAWRLDQLSPGGGCASCVLSPAVDAALQDRRVDVLLGGEVTAVRGAFGRFDVEVSLRPRYVDLERCLGCPACVEACPVERPDGAEGGLGLRKAISLPFAGCLPYVPAVDPVACTSLTGGACRACIAACPAAAVRLDERPSSRTVRAGAIVLAVGSLPGDVAGPAGVVSTWRMERMLNSTGPTAGQVRGASGGSPEEVLLVPTREAAERDGALATAELLKLARALRGRLGKARVRVAGALLGGARRAWRAPAAGEAEVEVIPAAWVEGGVETVDGRLAVTLVDGAGVRMEPVDLLVVHAAGRPATGTSALASLLGIGIDEQGFLEETGAGVLEPTATRSAGVFVAGAAAGPRLLGEAVRDGAAAAGRILASLRPGARLEVEPRAPEPRESRCSGCGACIVACALGAIRRAPETGKARVEPLHCRGCGGCAAACPTGAMGAPHQTREQIAAELSALLGPGGAP